LSKEELILEKCVFCFGYFGLMRISEIHALKFEDLKFNYTKGEGELEVTIRKSKTSSTSSTFFITDCNALKIIENYMNIVPNNLKKGNLFKTLRKSKDGSKIININVGINKIRLYSKDLAKKIGRIDFNKFSSHTFRRSGATQLANNDISGSLLKKAGRWSSESIANSYVDNSDSTKKKIANSFKENVKVETGKNKDVKVEIEENVKVEKNEDAKVEIEEKKKKKVTITLQIE
jgi:integrase